MRIKFFYGANMLILIWKLVILKREYLWKKSLKSALELGSLKHDFTLIFIRNAGTNSLTLLKR